MSCAAEAEQGAERIPQGLERQRRSFTLASEEATSPLQLRPKSPSSWDGIKAAGGKSIGTARKTMQRARGFVSFRS